MRMIGQNRRPILIAAPDEILTVEETELGGKVCCIISFINKKEMIVTHPLDQVIAILWPKER